MTVIFTQHRSAEDACPIRGEEAMSLVGELTRASWALAGLPSPSYRRSEIPVRFVDRE